MCPLVRKLIPQRPVCLRFLPSLTRPSLRYSLKVSGESCQHASAPSSLIGHCSMVPRGGSGAVDRSTPNGSESPHPRICRPSYLCRRGRTWPWCLLSEVAPDRWNDSHWNFFGLPEAVVSVEIPGVVSVTVRMGRAAPMCTKYRCSSTRENWSMIDAPAGLMRTVTI